MFDAKRDDIDGPSTLKDLCGEFLTSLALIGSGLPNVLRWLRDEAQRNRTSRELYLLSDYYLKDIGVRRCNVDLRNEDLVKRLRAGG